MYHITTKGNTIDINRYTVVGSRYYTDIFKTCHFTQAQWITNCYVNE